MLRTVPTLPAPTETGTLGVYQLKRLWARALAARRGQQSRDLAELRFDQLVLDALGLGLEQAQQYLLRDAPSFEEFERWVVATTGGVEPEQMLRINALVTGAETPPGTRQRLAEIEAMAPVLSAEDLAHWAEHGYVIVHDAAPSEITLACATASRLASVMLRLISSSRIRPSPLRSSVT